MSMRVEEKFDSYPEHVQGRIKSLRSLILKIAMSDDQIDFTGEDLKWGEPSFLTKTSGSTIRIDWKQKNPHSLSLYVNCNTKLISIFEGLYPKEFEYIGNRELKLPLTSGYSEEKLANCIELALKYNLIKDQF